MTALRSALDNENVTESTGKSMCFTCFLAFFGSDGASFSLPFVADGFSAGSFGSSALFAGLSAASPGFSVGLSVVSSYRIFQLILCLCESA